MSLTNVSMNDVLDSAPCGFLTIANDGLVQMANTTLLRMLGAKCEDVVGRPFHLLLSTGSRIFYQTHLFPLLKMRGEFEEVYISLRTIAGEEIPMLINGKIRDGDRGTLYDYFLVRVRQRAQFESALLAEREKAEKASKAKDDFLAALSHELRTPLNPILLLSTEMELDETLPTEVRKHAGIIRSNAELEARLMDDLLDLTRIAHGKFHLVPSVFSLHDLLRHTKDIVSDDCTAKHINLHFTTEAQEHHMRGDFARMQQVFWNLVKNAIKFTPKGGEIHVVTQNITPDQLVVTVTDNGIGISTEMQSSIFDAFDQGSIATHQFGGLGLGLAIVKSIVNMHAGSISVSSSGAGEGATFTVELSTCAPPMAPASIPMTSATSSLRILMVEDHDSSREVMTRILERSGHEVHSARDGAEALLLAASLHHFDLVISDIGLPDQSGLELMRQLHTQYGFPGIALTGYGMEEDLKNTRAAGFFAHLVKPVIMNQLRSLLSQVQNGALDQK